MAEDSKVVDQIEQLLEEASMHMALIGFAVVKEIATLRKQQQGTIQCPRCITGTVRFSIAPSNGHMHAKCSTENCISAME